MDAPFRYSLSPANLAALARLGADCADPFWVRLGMDDYVRQLIALAGEGYECVLIEAPHPDGTAAYTLSGRGWTIVKAMWQSAAQAAKPASGSELATAFEVEQAQLKAHHLGREELEVEDGAAASRGEDGIWVQSWLFLSHDELYAAN